jgi:hypothetical protein
MLPTVSGHLTNPEYLLAQAKAKVSPYRKTTGRCNTMNFNYKGEIKKLNTERQEFITTARKERMPDEEFTPQISTLYDKEKEVLRRLTTIERVKDDFTKLDSEEQ